MRSSKKKQKPWKNTNRNSIAGKYNDLTDKLNGELQRQTRPCRKKNQQPGQYENWNFIQSEEQKRRVKKKKRRRRKLTGNMGHN